MTPERYDQRREFMFTLAGIVAMLGGFGLLRLSANVESYILLIVAFALMFWGLMAAFTEHHGSSGA